MRQALVMIMAVIAIVFAIATGSQSLWISGKAIVAQHLLDSAWQQSQRKGTTTKPWPWADISTVARLDVPSLDESLIVLNDASGEAMAFGPGLVAGNPDNANRETVAVGGHRDTHLAFLEHLQIGSLLFLESRDGNSYPYILKETQVVDSRTHTFAIAKQQPGLVLITCYPFSATQTGGPLRLVATALPVGTSMAGQSQLLTEQTLKPGVGEVSQGIGIGNNVEPLTQKLLVQGAIVDGEFGVPVNQL